MGAYKIKIMNKIAQEGLDLFGSDYDLSTKQDDPHGIIVRSSLVDLDQYPSLLAVARAGAGVNNIPVQEASNRGICVFNTPGANANAVVDLVFPMIGIWLRNIYKGIFFCNSLTDLPDEKVSEHVEQQKAAFKGVEIAGKTLGVMGLGQIGVRLANGGIYRKMNVFAYDPSPTYANIHNLLPEVVINRTMTDTLSKADIVSLHLPLNTKTRNLVNKDFIASMKKGAILVNYARGSIVDEQAVLEALDAGYLEAFICDFPSPAIIGHPKVLTTPHLGASTEESEENCSRRASNEMIGYLKYGNVSHSVNFPTIESIPSASAHTRIIIINKDVPGMIAFASNILGQHNINISSYINESNGTIGYNIIDIKVPVDDQVLAEIEENQDVIRTRKIIFKKSN